MSEDTTGVQEEKRRYTRYPTREAKVAYRVEGFLARLLGPSEEKDLPVRNVSARGICFLCSQKLKAGRNLQLSVEFPHGSELLRVKGEVAWVSSNNERFPYRVGVKFTDISPDAVRMLESITERLAGR